MSTLHTPAEPTVATRTGRMRAIVQRRYGGADQLVLDETDRPPVGDDGRVDPGRRRRRRPWGRPPHDRPAVSDPARVRPPTSSQPDPGPRRVRRGRSGRARCHPLRRGRPCLRRRTWLVRRVRGRRGRQAGRGATRSRPRRVRCAGRHRVDRTPGDRGPRSGSRPVNTSWCSEHPVVSGHTPSRSLERSERW